MAKAAGIIALILGIVALTPLPIIIGMWAAYVLPIAAIALGIVGLATAKGDPKAPGVLGIVFGGIGLLLNLTVWLLVVGLFAFGSGIMGGLL